MTDHPHLELETDAEAIDAFVLRENARTEAVLVDGQMEEDIATVRAILEAPGVIRAMIRRGAHLYRFRQSPDNPRGLWLRLPVTATPTPDADWEVVFDLDAHCAETGRIWVWHGADTAAFDPERVILRLSLEGSDLHRLVEFDCSTKAFVPGGFDLPPERGGLAWIDVDTCLWSSAREGDATGSGWSGTIRRLSRGMAPQDAPELHRTDATDLLCSAWVSKYGGAEPMEVRMRMPAIGMTEVTLHRAGRAPVTLPNPPDTTVAFNQTHFAYIARALGDHPAGTLVLGGIDSAFRRILFSPAPGTAVNEDSLILYGDWMLWTETEMLRPRIMALDLREPDQPPQEIVPPVPAEAVHVSSFDANPDAGDGTIALYLSGFLTPPQFWLFDLAGGVAGITFRKFYAQPAEFDTTGMEVRLHLAASADGTGVPYHIVLPKDHAAAQGDLPVLIHGYGGFGISMQPWYDPVGGKTWLEAGGAMVTAYIRGGAELGQDWYLQAKGAGRPRAFADFAAIASDLVERGYSRPARIGCRGGSNGGLLCGVMLTRYPERFGAVWASVGVHDMLRFTHFPAGRGWIDEYGDPVDPDARDWLRAYSPIHNIPAGNLPPALIDTSAHDDRVDPSHSRRFAAALIAAGHGSLFYQHSGGHGGGGASAEKARQWALGLAFLRKALMAGPDQDQLPSQPAPS
ncbi:MAG: S9 family peptidase [Tabrizicola sp.]|nr:S9 family peptidase [Tabrizicola sp.]